MTWHRTSLPNMDISDCTHVQQDLHFYNDVFTALSPFSIFELIYILQSSTVRKERTSFIIIQLSTVRKEMT